MCRRYQQGKCHKGRSCKWRHEYWSVLQQRWDEWAKARGGGGGGGDGDGGDGGGGGEGAEVGTLTHTHTHEAQPQASPSKPGPPSLAPHPRATLGRQLASAGRRGRTSPVCSTARRATR